MFSACKRRRAEDDPQLEEKVAQPQEIARSKHAAKVLRLGTAEGDRLLCLREPMEEAAVIEDQAAAHREARAPVRVNERRCRCMQRVAILYRYRGILSIYCICFRDTTFFVRGQAAAVLLPSSREVATGGRCRAVASVSFVCTHPLLHPGGSRAAWDRSRLGCLSRVSLALALASRHSGSCTVLYVSLYRNVLRACGRLRSACVGVFGRPRPRCD